MTNRRIRVGVIGAGRMGERHCRVYSGLSQVDFVGLSDVARPRGEAVASTYDVGFFPECGDLLDRVDAVSVATTTDSHFSVVNECLRRGIHVLVEKPLARELSEAKELVRQADLLAVTLQVGHIERFNPVFLELQTILEEMPIVALNVRRLSPFDTSNTDVDVVYDLMIYDIDIALTMLGPNIRRIQAHGRSMWTEVPDYAVASLSFEEGPIATLTASRVTEQKIRLLEITAVGAYVEADLLNKHISVHRRVVPEYLSNHQRPLRYRQEGLVEQIYIPTAEPLMLELQSFLRCIREGCRPVVSGRDGLRALEVATSIRAELDAVRRGLQVATGA